MVSFDLAQEQKNRTPRITVMGIGGAGGNIINALQQYDIKHIQCIAVNTDIQALNNVSVAQRIQIGTAIAEGMGTGANQEIGKIAAEEDISVILESLEGSDIVFLIAGFGGGTGTGAFMPIAKALQEKRILTVALITKPFLFEGNKRMQVAQNALQRIEEYADTVIVIPNQKLFESNDQEITLMEAFSEVNRTIANCICAVADTINSHGYINVDFADVKAIMTRMGKAVIGIGRAGGAMRAKNAIEQAIASKLLEYNNFKGAKSILLNIQSDASLSLQEISVITSYVHEQMHPEANIIVGTTIVEAKATAAKESTSITIIREQREEAKKEEEVNEEVASYSEQRSEIMVTLIATGFEDQLRTRAIGKMYHQTPLVNQYTQGAPKGSYYTNNAPHMPFSSPYGASEGNEQLGKQNSASLLEMPAYLRKNKAAEEKIQ